MDRFKKKTDENGERTINTYRTDTEEKIDETFSIAKVNESENKNQYEKNGKDDCGCKLYDSYAGSLFSEKRGDFAVCNRK